MIKIVVSIAAAFALLGPASVLACPGHSHAEGHACPCKEKKEAEKPCCAKKAAGEGCDCAEGCTACAQAEGEAGGEKADCGCGHAKEA